MLRLAVSVVVVSAPANTVSVSKVGSYANRSYANTIPQPQPPWCALAATAVNDTTKRTANETAIPFFILYECFNI
jgi:hypothetical protein